MKPRIKYKVWFLRNSWIHGITIYPFIFFKQARKDVTDRLFRHEMEHIYQVREEGWFRFYITYLIHSHKYGYENIPYEMQAREVENNWLSAKERYLKDSST